MFSDLTTSEFAVCIIGALGIIIFWIAGECRAWRRRRSKRDSADWVADEVRKCTPIWEIEAELDAEENE